MKAISLPVAIGLAVASLYLIRPEYSRDGDLTEADWIEVPATNDYWPGIRMADAERLRRAGVAESSLLVEVRTAGTPEAVRSFRISRREVTADEYAAFLATSAGAEIGAPAGWRNRRPPEDRSALPLTGITLAEAQSYARWRNARLPTEIEWEYAQRGTVPTDYPWGQDPDPGLAVVGTAGPVAAAEAGLRPDGSSRYVHNGIVHGVGNVAEWTTSPFIAYPVSEQRGANDFDPQQVVVRGGSFRSRPVDARLTSRRAASPTSRADDIGFRIVKDIR